MDGSAGTGVHRDAGPLDAGGSYGDGASRQHPDGGSDAGGGPGDASSGSADSSGGVDAVTGDDGGGSGEDAEIESGVPCVPPLVDCGGVCIDVTSDPFNCGACGVECPSQICVSSQCVGSTVGGLVFIGHDFAVRPASPGPAAVLSNAIFMSRSNPLHVLSYERHAQPVAVLSADAVMLGTAALIGRKLDLTPTVTDADIPSKLLTDSYDVLVVHDQTSAAAGDMAALGASWSATLTTFTQHYGIVVILDGGTGVGEMPQFSSATGLLQVMAQSIASQGSPLQVLAPGDAVGIGVVSPYAASSSSVFLTSEPNAGNVVYVVGGMTGDLGPVVIHKVF
jgi:hypothetical protein